MTLLDQLDPTAALTLFVGWRQGRRVEGRTLNIAGDVEAALREYAIEAAAILRSPGGRGYNPDDDQGDAPFLVIDPDELLDNVLIDKIKEGASLPVATSEESRRLKFYAVLIGNDPLSRTAFVHRGTPVQLATKNMIAVLNNALNRITEPIFAFNSQFDVIISPAGIVALNQKNFENLFKDSEPVLAKTSEWVEQLADVLPVENGSKAYLAERLKANVNLRRKVQAILKKPHLEKLTPDLLVEAMAKHQLDPDELMENGQLVFTSSTEREILQLLNEDLFTGDFSGDKYAASKKSSRVSV